MEIFGNILLATVPAGLVLYGCFYLVKMFFEKERQEFTAKLHAKHSDTTLPLRLQAYERMAIFLERIAPSSLMLRSAEAGTVLELQYMLTHQIREEFNHNLSQQIYMGDGVWQGIVNAKEEMIAIINQVAEHLDKDAPPIELAKAIFQYIIANNRDIVGSALHLLKEESRSIL